MDTDNLEYKNDMQLLTTLISYSFNKALMEPVLDEKKNYSGERFTTSWNLS